MPCRPAAARAAGAPARPRGGRRAARAGWRRRAPPGSWWSAGWVHRVVPSWCGRVVGQRRPGGGARRRSAVAAGPRGPRACSSSSVLRARRTRPLERGHLVLQVEDAPDALRGRGPREDSRCDLAQQRDVASRVAAAAARRTAGRHQPEPVVLPQRLRRAGRQLGRHRDDVDRGCRRSPRAVGASGERHGGQPPGRAVVEQAGPRVLAGGGVAERLEGRLRPRRQLGGDGRPRR